MVSRAMQFPSLFIPHLESLIETYNYNNEILSLVLQINFITSIKYSDKVKLFTMEKFT